MQATISKAPQPRPYVIGGASLEPGFEQVDREDYYSHQDDFFDQRQKLDTEPFIQTEKRTFTGSLEFTRKTEDQDLDQVQDKQESGDNTKSIFSQDFMVQTEPVTVPDVGGKVATSAMEGMQFILSAAPDIKLVTNVVKETSGALTDLVKENIFFSTSPAEKKQNPADEVKKEQAKAKIREIMANYEQDRMRLEMKKQEEAQKAMERMGVTHQDILATKESKSNVNYEGYLTLANVVLADMAKGWAKLKQILSQGISSSSKSKKNDLSMHSGAQEGQSMVSSAGSIVSAG